MSSSGEGSCQGGSGSPEMSEEHRKLVEAVDCLIEDVDKKYDECLVAQFIEKLERNNLRKGDYKQIQDRIKKYLDHPAFVMLNQARAYKILTSILTKGPKLFDEQLFESFWATIGSVVVNNSTSAVTEIFKLFRSVAEKSVYLDWLSKAKFQPTIKVKQPDFEISNFISLIEFHIKFCNNYHAKMSAERLLREIIPRQLILWELHSRQVPLILDLSYMGLLEPLIVDLMKTQTISMTSIILQLVEEQHWPIELRNEPWNFKAMLQDSFDSVYHETGPKLNNICRCLGYFGTFKQMNDNIAKLREANQMDAIIVYLTSSSHADPKSRHLQMTLLLCPMLLACRDDSAQVLIQKLMATREERDFVERNIKPKTVAFCLAQYSAIDHTSRTRLEYLYQVGGPNHEIDSNCSPFWSKWSTWLIVRTMICYIKCNHLDPKHYSNCLQCCRVIESSPAFRSCDQPFTLLELIHEGLGAIEIKEGATFDARPIAMELVQLLTVVHKRTESPYYNGMLSVDKFHLMAVEQALRFHDKNITREFVKLFDIIGVYPKNNISNQSPKTVDELTAHLESVLEPDAIQAILKRSKVVNESQHKSTGSEEHEPQESTETTFDSLLDEIINHKNLTDGIIDCY